MTIMKPLFDGVCKCQKWVENSNQTQLKPIIWYTSWYFSRGGSKKNSRGGGKKIFSALRAPHLKYLPPSTESLFTPLVQTASNFDILNKLKFLQTLQYLCQFWRYKNGRPHFENLKTRQIQLLDVFIGTLQ